MFSHLEGASMKANDNVAGQRRRQSGRVFVAEHSLKRILVLTGRRRYADHARGQIRQCTDTDGYLRIVVLVLQPGLLVSRIASRNFASITWS